MICNLSDFISVRDLSSYQILNELGVNNISLTFDSSILLEPLKSNKKKDETKRTTIGFSLLPFYKIYFKDSNKDDILINKIVDAINNLNKIDNSIQFKLFIFKENSNDGDEKITETLKEKLSIKSNVKVIPYQPDPRKMLYQVSLCDYFIGMRFHSIIFAYLSERPFLMINYHPKCLALAEYINLPQTSLISLNDILNTEFVHHIQDLLGDPKCYIARMPVEKAKQLAKKNLIPANMVNLFEN